MPEYSYITKDRKGRTVKGKEFAVSERELITKLSRRELTPILIKEAKSISANSMLQLFGNRISTYDQMVFCRQLAAMIKGGVPLIRAIDSIIDETKNTHLRNSLSKVSYHIKEGDSLSASLKRLSPIFSTLFIAMVEAGERVGSLDTMLSRLSNYLEARDRLNRKIVTAVTYPAAILLFFVIAMAILTIVVIPRFKFLYEGFHAKLPTLTLVIFKTSDFVINNIWAITILLALLVYAAVYFVTKTNKGRRAFDAFTLKIPLFGSVIKKAAISKFSRTLAALLEQGISITTALELVGRTSGNVIIEESSLAAAKLILDGESIPGSFKKIDLFPPLMIQMTSVGVESGKLPELLDKTADFYENQVDMFVSSLTSLIEPILIVVLGAIMAFVVVGLYLPIFKLGQAMSGRG